MKKILNLAHRGFSGKYPENTRAAFDAAAAVSGCDGFETDVNLTRDGIAVIIHDPILGRTADKTGYVRDHTYEELLQADIGSWFDPSFRGERILRLDELLAFVQKEKLFVNLEIKNYEVFYEGIERIVIEQVDRLHMKDQVILSSFNHLSMELCKHIDPEIQTGLLYGYPLLRMEHYGAASQANALHPRYSCLQYEPDLVARAHEQGLAVNTWTVNEREELVAIKALNVDCIISNYPDLCAEVLAAE